jgi:hypothetical protein
VDEQAQSTLMCPKCDIEMKRMWRGGRGPHRCPQCRGIFLDTEEMRRRRRERKPKPFAVLANVVVNVLIAVAITRWIKRRRPKARQGAV